MKEIKDEKECCVNCWLRPKQNFCQSRGQPIMVDHTWPDPFTPIQAKLGSRLTWLGQSGWEGFLLIIISPSKIVLH